MGSYLRCCFHFWCTSLLPRYLRQGITTIPDFIEARFDKGTKQFVTFFLVSYVVNMLPITLYSGAVAMSQIFSIEEIFGITYAQGIWVMVWVIGIVGAIYAIFGGLKAVAVSDSINGVALVVGGLLVPLFSILYIGSGNFMEDLSTLSPQRLRSSMRFKIRMTYHLRRYSQVTTGQPLLLGSRSIDPTWTWSEKFRRRAKRNYLCWFLESGYSILSHYSRNYGLPNFRWRYFECRHDLSRACKYRS